MSPPTRFPLPDAPAGVSIVEVANGSFGTQLVITFSGAIAWNGVDVPSAFRAFTGDGFFDGCIEVIGVGSNWIEVGFNAGVAPGAAWELNGVMDGITPEVSFPASGTVAV